MSNLLPGAGWPGATVEPAAQGAPGAVGYSAKAIARWDVVPFQTFTGAFNVGVVAFHREGINRVEFAVNGGPWVSITTPTINPQVSTGKPEYWATLNAADFADGPLEVRAVVYPNIGACRVLAGPMDGEGAIRSEHSLLLYANANGSLPAAVRYVSQISGSDSNDGRTPGTAVATISAARNQIYHAQAPDVGGGTIAILDGSHALGAATESSSFTASRWLTIQPADGVPASAVTITGSGSIDGLRTERVRLHNVTIAGWIASASIARDYLWISGCKFSGPSLTADVTPGGWYFKYITDTACSTAKRMLDEFEIARNVTFENIGESGIHNIRLAVNCGLAKTVLGAPDFHGDVLQLTSEYQNTIWYGIRAVEGLDQTTGIRIQPSGTDVAIVDVEMTMGNSLFLWELERPYRNFYIKNCAFKGAFNCGGTFLAENFVFSGCKFSQPLPAIPGAEFVEVGDQPAPVPPTPTPAPDPAPAPIPQPPVVTSGFPNATVRKGGNHTFSIQASGPNLEYKWQKGTTILRGVTGPTYTVSLAKPKDAGVYAVKVWNSDGAVQASARLTVV